MGGLRAKDADRDRFVELIEAAYVDGQLSTEDRELRVTRALSAATVDELEALTRDLQGRPAPAVVPHAASPARGQRPLALVVLGLVVSVLGLGVGALVMLASPDAEPVTQTGVEAVEQPAPSEPAPSESAPVAVEPEVEPFEMTPAQVRRFLGEYEQKFGTLDSFGAAFYPARVSLEVPVRGSRPRFERWSYDGTWRQDSDASAVTSGAEIVDLGAVNVPRLFANITTAKRTLNVQRGKLTHVVVHKWSFDEVPSVNIYVGNSFNESGYLKTTMSGDPVRSFPYEP